MIYVASSWRNEYQRLVVELLRKVCGLMVYDFKNPSGDAGDNGFHWSEIDTGWQGWDPAAFRGALEHPIAVRGFGKDKAALDAAAGGLLVQPCGRSAHLEIGYLAARGIPTAVWFPAVGGQVEPELMLRVCDRILIGTEELVAWGNAQRPDAEDGVDQ